MTTPYGEGAQSGAEGTQSGAGESTGESVTTTDPATGAQSGAAPATEPVNTVDRSELEKQQARTKAADERAARLDAELKQLRDKDLPEIDKLKRGFAEAQEQVQTLQTTNRDLALQVAFLSDNTHTWHDPKTALKLVDLAQVTVEESGEVSGLKDALKALATSHPFLIKQEATTEAPKPPSTAPGNNGSTGGKPAGAKAMATRLPALQTRPRRS